MIPFDPETPPEEGWIPPCPPSGTGCHAWLYRAVNSLVAGGWPDEAVALYNSKKQAGGLGS